MIINKKIIDALKSLKIPVAYSRYSGDSDKYIVFRTIGQNEDNFADDNPTIEDVRIGINYWFKKDEDVELMVNIKTLLKEAGFIKISESDLSDDESYGRAYYYRFIER